MLRHDGRNGRSADDLTRRLSERRHTGYDVYDLKPGLLAGQNPFLSGNEDHGHGAQQRVACAGREIECARAQGA
jgi:hypothetical protein